MPRLSNHFVVDRPIGAVFDVVTTVRFWTGWHPPRDASKATSAIPPAWVTRSSTM